MFATLFFFSLVLIRTVFAQSGFSISTPDFVQCQPIQITWTDSGNAPYDLFVVSADDVCGDVIEDLGTQNSTAMTWTVDLPAGIEVVLFIQDAADEEAWSGTIAVANSNDTSCLANTTSSAVPSVSAYGTVLNAPPTTAPPPAPSALAPAGAANAGVGSSSAAFLTRPVSTVTLLGSTVLAVFAFTL